MKTIRFDQLRNEEWFFFDKTLHKEPFVAKKLVGKESWHMNSVTLDGTEKFMSKDAMVFPLGFDKSYLDEAEKKEMEWKKREEEIKKAFWKNLAEEEAKKKTIPVTISSSWRVRPIAGEIVLGEPKRCILGAGELAERTRVIFAGIGMKS